MASFNRVILLGNLTRDPELRYIPSGQAVCDITIAVNHRYKNANGDWVDEVAFVDVTLWARTAEVVCEYLGKGSPIFIEGRLKYDTWEKDGQKHAKLRVVAEKMQLIGGRGDGQQGGPSRSGGRPARSSQGPPSNQGSADAAEYGAPEYSPSAGRSDSHADEQSAPSDIPF